MNLGYFVSKLRKYWEVQNENHPGINSKNHICKR